MALIWISNQLCCGVKIMG